MTPPDTGTATRPARHADMVRWLHPQHLLRTGLDALVSAVFGERADRRVLEGLARPQEPFFDYSQESPDGTFWLDYVADTGDGWNSTYAVASALAASTLSLSLDGRTYETSRGRVLVLGGDAVYPVASRAVYEERLVQPYEAAMRRSHEPHPHLFAIPGNHDWYDGLAAFLRLFCAHRWLGGWKTWQSRSYFALRLPRGWWLLGTDTQLSSDIDVPQVEYFRQVAAHMGEEDKVILCSAEPAWLLAAEAPRKRGYLENNLAYLQEKVLGQRVRVFIAGDLHHYRRHQDGTGRQKVIAGGGGAFLHPTHAPSAPTLPGGYVQQKVYPDEATSRRLALGNLALPWHSPRFGLFTGAIYLLLALSARAEVGTLGLSRLPEVLGLIAAATVSRPATLALGAATLLGLMGFARGSYRRGGLLAGALHTLAHLGAALGVAWGATYLTVSVVGLCPELLPGTSACSAGTMHLVGKFALASALTFLGGYVVGPLVLGLYLLLSVNGFGAHWNEAFSSQPVPDWKNFLRLSIGPDGTLTLYPVGLRRVPRRWKRTGAGPHAPVFASDDPRATPPELIEPPVRL